MRPPRHFGLPGRSFHHCVSRIVDKRIVFHREEKEIFRSILRKLEDFCGLRVATYCLMGNHFHLLLEVPEPGSLPPLTPESLLKLLPLLYGKATVDTIATQLETARKSGNREWELEILARFERRRGDLSVFLKELKQRVSLFMNHRLGRSGTLWEGRFRSVLVEDGEEALLAVAAYIDLNPVRAGLVDRPEDYRWSGYGEAMGSGKRASTARRGLSSIQREALESRGAVSDATAGWKNVRDRYRRLLYLEGADRGIDATTDKGLRRGIAPEVVSRVLEEGGTLSLPEILRHRVRYFSAGAAIGSAAFVERAFDALRQLGRTGPKRLNGARRMRGAEWGNLRVLRDLRVAVFDDPPG